MVTGMAHGDSAQSAARTPTRAGSRREPPAFRQSIAKIVSGGQAGADRKYIAGDIQLQPANATFAANWHLADTLHFDLSVPAKPGNALFFKVAAFDELPAKEGE